MRKGYFLLVALSCMMLLISTSTFAQSTAGPIQITSFADSTNILAGDNFPQTLMLGKTYNIQGAYGDIGAANWVRLSYDIYKSDWSGLDYGFTWWIANDTLGVLDGAINYDFTIPEDGALTADFVGGFSIIQARVEYDPINDTFWNIFVKVTADTVATALLNPTPIEGIKLFPNPSTERSITIETPRNLTKQVLISDLSGRVIKAGEIFGNGTVAVGDLTPGLYLVSVREENSVSTLKLRIE